MNSPYVDLSPRQVDMLVDAAEGLTRQECGRKRYLGEGTVHSYRKEVCRKLNAKNMLQAIALWLTMEPAPAVVKRPASAPRPVRVKPAPKGVSPWRRSMVYGRQSLVREEAAS